MPQWLRKAGSGATGCMRQDKLQAARQAASGKTICQRQDKRQGKLQAARHIASDKTSN